MKLVNGNIVILRNKEKLMYVEQCGFYKIDNFEFKFNTSAYDLETLRHEAHRELDIIKVCESDISTSDVIWEGDNINWDELPMGTLVRVKDFPEDNWKYGKLVTYTDDSRFPFTTLVNDINSVDSFRYCEIIEEPPKLENASNLPIAKLEDIVKVASRHCEFSDCREYHGECAECMANVLSKKFEMRG